MTSTLARDIMRMSIEHIELVAVSIAVAMILGIPLGILVARRTRGGASILRFVDIVQTIPSLALFGLLIPLPFIGGIGARTAIIALILYSLLPIVRMTVLGINEVPAELREAAVALGMSDRQILRSVELPLAIPSIMNGIRIAIVVGIGLATIAAAVGGGGLGTFIFRGVAMVDTRLILAGAIPAALMAIIADVVLTRAERRLAMRYGRF